MAAKYTGILIVDGITLPDPSEMTPSDYDISDSERNANGKMIAQLVREDIHKVECKWKRLRPDDWAIVKQAIKKKFGLTVQYSEGEFEMYAGDRKTPIYTYENGSPVYKDITLNFIEM